MVWLRFRRHKMALFGTVMLVLPHLGMSPEQARDRAIELLTAVGIPDAGSRLENYPHQFSGGMRQRVMIAIALACEPSLLIADEPSTALDVTIQAQIVELVMQLREQLGMAIIWITHDLGVIAGLADRVIVMYAGYIVEEADVDSLYSDPRHPYTLALLAALPRADRRRDRRLASIPGAPPNLLRLSGSSPGWLSKWSAFRHELHELSLILGFSC